MAGFLDDAWNNTVGSNSTFGDFNKSVGNSIGGDIGKFYTNASGANGMGFDGKKGGFFDPLNIGGSINDYMHPDNSAEIAAQQAAIQKQLLDAANQVNLKDMQSSQAASQAFRQTQSTSSPGFLLNGSSNSQGRGFSINDFLGL